MMQISQFPDQTQQQQPDLGLIREAADATNKLDATFAQLWQQPMSAADRQTLYQARVALRSYGSALTVISQHGGNAPEQTLKATDQSFQEVISSLQRVHSKPQWKDAVLNPGLRFKNSHEPVRNMLSSPAQPTMTQPQTRPSAPAAPIPATQQPADVPVASNPVQRLEAPSASAALQQEPVSPQDQLSVYYRETYGVDMTFDATGRPVLSPIEDDDLGLMFDTPSMSIPAPQPALTPSL